MSDWDLEVRPHLTPYFAYGAAASILAVHVTVGVLLKISSTGVIFQTADQVAIALLGVVIAGMCCCSHGHGCASVRLVSRCETCSATG